jgi:hypothetical protein
MKSLSLALALLGAVGFAGDAAAQSYSQTQCRTVSSRGVSQSVCTRNSVTPAPAPRPSEPFRRGPGTVEVVRVAPQAQGTASVAAAAPRQTGGDNFCGPGYRAVRDGSCISLSSAR